MGRLELEGLARPRKEAQAFSFSDPLRPDIVLTLWLRPLDWLEEEAARENADALVLKYVVGGWMDESGEFQKEPLPMHALDGEPIIPNRKALVFASMLEAMQSPPPEHASEKYDALYFCKYAVLFPSAWTEIQTTAYNVMASYGKAEKKTGIPTPEQSQPVSKQDSSTQTSPEASLGNSEASPTESGACA